MVRASAAVALWIGIVAGAVTAGCGGGPDRRGDGEKTRVVGAPVMGGAVGASAATAAAERRARAEAPEPAAGAPHAVVIGISKYADARIPALHYARSDAESVYSFLVDEMGMAVPRRNVMLLLDEEATRERIQQAILAANDAVNEPDRLIVYFAGHGAVDLGPKGELLGNYLLPFDAKTIVRGGQPALDVASGLAIAKLQQLLQVNRARSLLIVLDACFSGGGGRSLTRVVLDSRQASQSEAELEGLKESGAGRAVIMATAPNQPALEVDRFGGGLFTHYFLESLNYDANLDGRVTLAEAYDYLYTRVKEEALRRGFEQTPTIKENRTGIVELRTLPRTRFKVGLAVRYGPATPPLEGRAEAAAVQPVPVADARQYAVEVSARETSVPLRVYLLRLAITAAGVWAERLLPDGENALAPPATVSEGRRAVYPDESETGSPLLKIRASERDAHVLYVLLASATAVDLKLLDRTERKLYELAGSVAPSAFARRAAAILEAEPELKHVALRYLFVKHGRGAPEGKAGGPAALPAIPRQGGTR